LFLLLLLFLFLLLLLLCCFCFSLVIPTERSRACPERSEWKGPYGRNKCLRLPKLSAFADREKDANYFDSISLKPRKSISSTTQLSIQKSVYSHSKQAANHAAVEPKPSAKPSEHGRGKPKDEAQRGSMLSFRTILRSLALGAAFAGVVAVPAASRAASIFVSIGPPVAPVYVRPPLPGYGYIWVDGYWAWGDDGYYWVPGYWTLPPYEGAVWEPGVWGYGGGGWGWTAGYWAHPVGYWGGVYYSNPWPWVGAYGICHEGFYRNSFYDRGYYNGWYNDRWGHEHGRDFDDRRWNQTRTYEARWNGDVHHGGSRDNGFFSGRRSAENTSVQNGQFQRGGNTRGGGFDHGIRPENRGTTNTPALNGQVQHGVGNNGAAFNHGIRPENRTGQQYSAQRPVISSHPVQSGSLNRGQADVNRSSNQSGVRSVYPPQGMNNAYRAPQAYRPQQNYGGGQRYSTPQTTNIPRYSAPTPRYNQQQAYGGGGQRYSAPAQHYSAPAQHYNAPAQHYSAPAQHYSAPAQAQHYSGGGNAGGDFRGNGGGQHGHR
jgi:hypothetical protein